MPDINGIPYVESTDLVSGWPTVSQSVAQEVSDQLASKLPFSFGTATPSTTDSGFLWYDSNSTPAAPKFWDGAAFQALTSGKILQVVRATMTNDVTTTSTSFVDVTGMSVTITPQKSDSAVVVVFLFSAGMNSGSPSARGDMQITDSSNNPISGAESMRLGFGIGSASSIDADLQQSLWAYATPATTSPVTYKARFSSSNAAHTFSVFGSSHTTAQMYALEVSA